MIFPSNKRKARYINENLYIVHAVISIDRVKNPTMIKEWLGVDTTFKVQREGTYWFCELVEEPEWEEIN
jgi:hypothetical protein